MLYLFRPWSQEPCLSIQLSVIIKISESDRNHRTKSDWRLHLTIPAQSERSLAAKLYEGFQVLCICLPLFSLSATIF